MKNLLRRAVALCWLRIDCHCCFSCVRAVAAVVIAVGNTISAIIFADYAAATIAGSNVCVASLAALVVGAAFCATADIYPAVISEATPVAVDAAATVIISGSTISLL